LAEVPAIARNSGLKIALGEVQSRLNYLTEAGLGYLTLDRASRTLSGGETERVNLAACLGARLVNTLFVLDEPSVGLHARDTENLVRILRRLRDVGNTVVVVEHEAAVMRAADQIVDLGPASGRHGGELVFQGTYAEMLRSGQSLTGKYLSGVLKPEARAARPVALPCWPSQGKSTKLAKPPHGVLSIAHATLHNLQDLAVDVPLERLVCITGVSGSGKTTFAREVLYPALSAKLNARNQAASRLEPEEEEEDETAEGNRAEVSISGWEGLGGVMLVDQAVLAKTPRSNPAVYIGAFDGLREFFARTEVAKQRGLNASAFSFNSGQGQCERCRGAGFEKIEMQFLSDVFIQCPDCEGKRYRPHILEVTIAAPADVKTTVKPEWSISDFLQATVDDSVTFLRAFPDSRHATETVRQLRWLQDVGLGYLQLGQPLNTLSGGENQRLKLVRHLAEFDPSAPGGRMLFLFDEPTTGLHFHDVGVLLKVFHRLVDEGHSVLVIEHNLEVIRSADWIIDLGPEGGPGGGKIVAAGPPAHLIAAATHTGRALAKP
jgi:excinuclease ABC subunit A